MADIPSFGWHQADSQAIAYRPDDDAWRAGIVKDILRTPAGNVLVAAQSGGVWSVAESGTGLCVLDSDHPDMWCLAQGTLGPDHCFAGGDTLFETDVSQNLPLLSWIDLDPRDAMGNTFGPFFRVIVLAAQQTVVVAAGNGVYWSRIPAEQRPGCLGSLLGAKATRAPYVWTQATGLPSCWFSGLVAGPPGLTDVPTVVAAAWGNGETKGDVWGIFVGAWGADGNLHFVRSTAINGIDIHKMCYTVLAAHEDDPRRMYASVSNRNGNLLGLLRSDDAGGTWNRLAGKISNPTSDHTDVYDTCINQGNDGSRPCNALGAGLSRRQLRVALGWRAGPLLSEDGGETFHLVNSDTEPHLHPDFHCMRFARGAQGEELYIGSDGGVAVTRDFGGSYVSSYSRQLLNLQLLGTTGAREWYGGLGVSPIHTGLVATGTQDNGNLICSLPAGEGWTFVEGGDGRIVSFLGNDTIFHYFGDDDRGQLARWTGGGEQQLGVIPYYQDRVLRSVIFERVEQPEWRDRDGRLMYGVGGVDVWVYGLVADANGDHTHWVYVAGLPIGLQTVSTVSSRTGHFVLAGTNGGRIFRVNPADDLDVVEQPVAPLAGKEYDPTRAIHRIVIADDRLAFASFNAADGSNGSVLRWDGASWQTVPSGFPNEFIFAMEIDLQDDGPVVYLATDTKVYASSNNGDSWTDVSAGLPKRPHCSDLRRIEDSDGIHLYLSTFGRSLWRGDLVTFIQVQPR
jgi:hypothetical protein